MWWRPWVFRTNYQVLLSSSSLEIMILMTVNVLLTLKQRLYFVLLSESEKSRYLRLYIRLQMKWELIMMRKALLVLHFSLYVSLYMIASRTLRSTAFNSTFVTRFICICLRVKDKIFFSTCKSLFSLLLLLLVRSPSILLFHLFSVHKVSKFPFCHTAHWQKHKRRKADRHSESIKHTNIKYYYVCNKNMKNQLSFSCC